MARKKKNEAITESTTANETYVAPKLIKEDAVSDYPKVTISASTIPHPHHHFNHFNRISISTDNPTIPEEKPAEEWIWVEGYKGTHKDLTAYGNFQFEMNKVYEMPEDATIEACDNGFHFCLNLKDVFGYYKIGNGNRFFKVRGLVRKKDFKEYGTLGSYFSFSHIDKLAAKSIEILWELSPDEVLTVYDADLIKDWTYDEKLLALETDPKTVGRERKAIELAKLGYSIPFAKYIVEDGKYEAAKIAASIEGLSMDMRVYVILQGKKDKNGDPFGEIARSLKRMANSLYGSTASAGAMSAQLDAYRALMNAGAQCADGLRAGAMSK